MIAAQLSWPGVDKQRALDACRALRLAALMLRYGQPAAGLDDIREARGLLGAIGFEKGGRL